MRGINPTCKFVGILLPTLLLALFYRPVLNLAAFALCLLILLVSRVPPGTLGKALLPALFLAVGMFFTGYQFPSGAALGLQRLLFTDMRVYNGLQLASRVLAFAGFGLLFVLTTDKVAFIQSLEEQARLPSRFAYGILAAWGILPLIRLEYRKTKAAFRVRGLRPLPFSPALLVPLLVKAVRWSESLACALESKGFGDGTGRTRYRTSPVGPRDILFPLAATALVVAGLASLG